MNDLSIGCTLDIKSNDDVNPQFDDELVKTLFKTLPGRKHIKVSANDFYKQARKYSIGVEIFKTNHIEESIEKDKFGYQPRNYHGRLGELAVQYILGVQVSNDNFGHSSEQDHHDLIFRGHKLGVKTGTIRKFKRKYFTSGCRTPIMYGNEKLPQIITLVDEEVNCAYILGIIFPKDIKNNLNPKLNKLLSLVLKRKFGLSTFSESVVIPFDNADQLEEILNCQIN